MNNLDMADLKRPLHAKTITLAEFVKYSGKLSRRMDKQPADGILKPCSCDEPKQRATCSASCRSHD